jgi:acyl-CoA thioester hydrolase
MYKPYFPAVPGAPAPLRLTLTRQVRFEEVDAMGIVWHGRYPSFFEDGRVTFGRKYGISYADFIREGVPVPVRRIQIDYYHPLKFEDEFKIETTLHWSDAARINFEYGLRNTKGHLVTTGCTVQLMVDRELKLLLEPPLFFAEFLERWRRGDLA